MDKPLFDLLCKKYSSVISDIINSNVRFYRTNCTIRWQFGYDERQEIFASCNRNTNVITVNILAVDLSYNAGSLYEVEYFLLHEIRHIFQHLEINDYRTNPSKCNNAILAKQWAEEDSNYVTALDTDGKENPDYFKQDMEMDAYAYSYSVMKYKYKEVDDLYLPECYRNSQFDKIVAEWLDSFKKEGL